MVNTYPVPCAIQATTNDHLLLADLTIAAKHVPEFITGLRALQDAKLHCLLLHSGSRDLPMVAEGEQIIVDFGGHKLASLSGDQLDTLEYYALDRLLGLCKPNLRCNLRLEGAHDLLVEMSVRVQD